MSIRNKNKNILFHVYYTQMYNKQYNSKFGQQL